MAELSLQIEKITGTASGDAASSVFSSRVSFADGSVGTLVSCILVLGKSPDVGGIIKDIFDVALRKFEQAESGSLETLKSAVKFSRDSVLQGELDVSFVHALFYKNAVYIGKSGERVKIFVYEPPKSVELTFEFGSGPVKADQLYLLATEKFFASFDVDSFLKNKEIEIGEFVDQLATEISAKNDQSEIGAVLIYAKGEIDEEPRPVPEEKPQIDTTHELSPAPSALAGVSKFKFKNPLPFVFLEIAKLRRGDIKAIFRLRRNIVAIAVVILLILAISAFLTIRGNIERGKLNEFKGHLETASAKYEEGLAILDLNRERARGILVEADEEIKKALKINQDSDKAKELAANISAKLKETESSSSIDFETIADVSGQIAALFTANGSLVAVTDSKIHEINVASATVSESDGVGNMRDAAFYDNKVFVFEGVNVHRIDLASGKAEKIFEGQEAFDIAAFLGNVYLLGSSQIYKYTPIEGGYAAGVNYLNDSEQFAISSRFAIDGSVWVSRGSEVSQYLRGEKQDFKIAGLSGAAQEYGEIYTDPDLDNIYVIDRTNSALLAVGKDGVYKKAYQASEFAKAADLVVDEEKGKFYIAIGSKVLGANL